MTPQETELIDWHAKCGMDLQRLFDDRPDLFRLVAAHSEWFQETEIGRAFVEKVQELARAALATPEYRTAFDNALTPRTPKEEQAVGLVADDDEDDD